MGKGGRKRRVDDEIRLEVVGNEMILDGCG